MTMDFAIVEDFAGFDWDRYAIAWSPCTRTSKAPGSSYERIGPPTRDPCAAAGQPLFRASLRQHLRDVSAAGQSLYARGRHPRPTDVGALALM